MNPAPFFSSRGGPRASRRSLLRSSLHPIGLLTAALALCVAAAPLRAAAVAPALVDVAVDGQPLFLLIERIARQCNAGILVDASAAEAMTRNSSISLRDARFADAIAYLATTERIALSLIDDRLHVTDVREAFQRRLVTRSYDVRLHLVHNTNRPGPDLAVPQPGSTGTRLLPPVATEDPITVNGIEDIVRRRIRPETWNMGARLVQDGGFLVVTQIPEAHDEIRALLTNLERSDARQITLRLWTLPSSSTAAALTQLDATDLARPGSASLAAVLVARDGQQVHSFSGLQSAYIADTDVVQNRFDPIVTVLTEGLVLDVETAITIGGVLATVRITRSHVAATATSAITDDRDRTLATTQLPQTHYQNARDTRLIPPGKAALYRLGDRLYALTCAVGP